MSTEHETARADFTPGISDEELLRRAVKWARDPTARGQHCRYVGVKHAFALGMTYARGLCIRFGLDPDEKVRR